VIVSSTLYGCLPRTTVPLLLFSNQDRRNPQPHPAPCLWLAANDDQGLAEALQIASRPGISGI